MKFKKGDKVLLLSGAAEIMYKYGLSFVIHDKMKKCENTCGVIEAKIRASLFTDGKERYRVIFKDDYFHFVDSCLEIYDVQRLQMIELENSL